MGSSNLVVRVYAGDTGLTAVYYAAEEVNTVVEIDREKLGFPHGNEGFHVSLKKGEAGYTIIGV